MGTDVTPRLVRCFSLAFAGLGLDEIPRASVASVPKWDSLAVVTLVALVEEEFGVSVEPDDLDEFVSFELIRDYLQRKAEAHGS
jgi:acyl carrier protein